MKSLKVTKQLKKWWTAWSSIFDGNTTANQNQKNNSFYSETDIPRPFNLQHDNEKGYFIRIGNYRLTEPKKTADEATEEIPDTNWDFLMNTITAIIDMNNKLNQDQK